jgi:hypothetical protein
VEKESRTPRRIKSDNATSRRCSGGSRGISRVVRVRATELSARQFFRADLLCKLSCQLSAKLCPLVVAQRHDQSCLSTERSRGRNRLVAHRAHSVVQVAAAVGIIDAIAVADIEAALAAVPPDRVLDEPGKGARKGRIELSGIDPVGDGCNNVGAAARPVAGQPGCRFGAKSCAPAYRWRSCRRRPRSRGPFSWERRAGGRRGPW